MNYKVPFVAYKLQYQKLKREIDRAMQDVLERGDLIMRQDVEDFEKSLADFVGVKHAVALNSGTDALFFSLKVLEIGPGDEVITVSHTFVASIAAIAQAGAKPVLVDVGDDYLMDMNLLERAITDKTKAVIPVHLNGKMCDMKRLTEIAKRHNLFIVEDSAQSLGAEFEGKRAGSIGITGCFSFYPAKILGCFGDGGALTTNQDDIAKKARLLRDHGQLTKTDIECFGWNSRLDNLQAAVLNIKIKHLPEWIKKRQEIASKYSENLQNITGIKLPSSEGVFQNYVILAEKRDELFQFLKDRGVETLIKDPVANHLQRGLGLSHFKLPISERLAKEVISLPMYPELNNEQIDYVIRCVKDFYHV
jgi:dTDP-3-amino-2,3,6-trideoxy-4-keto-D-glucose/dTDP-3-amino-3,4,6-trideoxy-alpha-D-glucose/dTDP-2,6-dideoxy-D-kanosamine transaminase